MIHFIVLNVRVFLLSQTNCTIIKPTFQMAINSLNIVRTFLTRLDTDNIISIRCIFQVSTIILNLNYKKNRQKLLLLRLSSFF